MPQYANRGYLTQPYRIFHIRDQQPMTDIGYHYHDFHKLVLFVSGQAEYEIEGRCYRLAPGDVVVVERGRIHRPRVDASVPYERYVLYLSDDFLRSQSTPECDLSICFSAGPMVVRPKDRSLQAEFAAVADQNRELFGSALLESIHVTQLLILLTRQMLMPHSEPSPGIRDPKIVATMEYIRTHLTQPLTVEMLAEALYISKYHLMRRFREETGYTIHTYLTNCRLLMAQSLLAAGEAPSQVCFRCGYADYSTFARAFRRRFGCSPGSHVQTDGSEPDLW